MTAIAPATAATAGNHTSIPVTASYLTPSLFLLRSTGHGSPQTLKGDGSWFNVLGRRALTSLFDVSFGGQALGDQTLRGEGDPIAEVVVQRELSQRRVERVLYTDWNCHQYRL